MFAQQLLVIIIQNADPAALLVAYAKLKAGNALTVGDTNVAAVPSIQNMSLIDQQMIFDGFAWNLILFVSSGG